MPKKQIAIYVDEEIWEKFKNENKGKASQKIEEYMRLCLQKTDNINFAPSEQIYSVSFGNPENWEISFSNSSLNINNTNTTATEWTYKIE